MININVDEGYAFDFLSILQVKHETIDSKELEERFTECKNYISKQIGSTLFSEIINSKEYKNCYLANLKTFEAVEKSRYGEISAKEVDTCNMIRYEAKVKLQKCFFDSSLNEYKT